MTDQKIDDDYPRSMRDPAVRQRRRAMLTMRHVVELKAYAAKLRSRGVMGKCLNLIPSTAA